MAYKDYYRVLEVERTAQAEVIQRAYRRLAKKFHPDINKSAGAEARFKEIQEAYEVLKDPDKRRLYDKYGKDWKAISEGRVSHASPDVEYDFSPFGFGGNVNDLRSIFETVFTSTQRGAQGGARPRTRRSDQETSLEIPLHAAFAGGPREISFTDTSTGEVRRLSVQVPPGVREGQRIRLQGQAAGGADLYLAVTIVPDERFRLKGDDVYTSLRVSPHEAVLGSSATLSTLDGQVKVKVPPNSSTGRQIRLKERGYPKREGGRGDLYAEIAIVVPSEATDEERALYEKLASISRFDPRR